MVARVGGIMVDITANSEQYEQQLKSARQQAYKFDNEFKKTNQNAARGVQGSTRAQKAYNVALRETRGAAVLARTALKSMVGITAGVVGGLLSIQTATTLMRTAFANTAAQQRAMTQLEAVVRSTGHAAGFTAAELAKMAAEFQKTTTFGDEAIIEGQAVLLTFTKIGKEVFPETVEAALNVSTAMGQDLKGAMMQLGKALNDPILGMAALRRVGIQFTVEQEAMIETFVAANDIISAQRLILKELEIQFGGSAEAARNNLGGAFKALQNAFGDLFEVSLEGSRELIENLNKLVDLLSDPSVVSNIQNIAAGFFNFLAGSIELLQRLSFAFNAFMEGDFKEAWMSTFNMTVKDAGIDDQRLLASIRLRAGLIRQDSRGAARAEVSRFNEAIFGAPEPRDMSGFDDIPDPEEAAAAAAAAEQLEAKVDTLIGSLMHQSAQLTRTARDQAIYNAIQQSGVDITSDYGRAIETAVGALYDQRAAITAAAEEENERLARMEEAQATALNFAQGFAETFVGGIREGVTVLDSLTNALNNLSNKLIDMATQRLVEMAFGALIGPMGIGAGGGLLGGALIPGVLHEGGVVGDPNTPRRMVPSSVFAGAQRFHAGLSPGEFPAILQQGETVLPRGGGMQGGKTMVQIEVVPSPYFDARVEKASEPVAVRVAQTTVASYDRRARRSNLTGSFSR